MNMCGHQVPVVALSKHQSRFVPWREATFFSLFPDLVFRPGQAELVYRMGEIELDVSGGFLRGRCAKWYDVGGLLDTDRAPCSELVRPRRALTALQSGLQEAGHLRYRFDNDLPVYLDTERTPRRQLNYGMLEWDVFRGCNWNLDGFRASLPRDIQAKLPPLFVDFEEDFQTNIDPEMLLSMVRHMVESYTRAEGGMALLPARWGWELEPSDSIVVECGVTRILHFTSPGSANLRIGPLDISLQRDNCGKRTRGRRGGRNRRVRQVAPAS